MLTGLINFLFPKKCLGCGTPQTYICARCVGNITPAEPLDIPNAMACFHYHDKMVKRALKMLKYKKQFSIAADLAQSLYDRLLEEIAESDQLSHRTDPLLLIPAPLSRERLRARGYNQAAVLAEKLKKLNPELFEINSKVIKKIKDTPSQVSVKDRGRRLKNLQGSFALDQGAAAKNRVLVIIDDVITTGATVSEITKILKTAEPRKIYALAVAHG